MSFQSPFRSQEAEKPKEKPVKKPAAKKPSKATKDRRQAAQAKRLSDEKTGQVQGDQRQDDLTSAGVELREGVDAPKQSKAQDKREEKAFAKPTEVDVLEVAGDTQHVVLRFDNASYTLDTQQALALSRLLDSAKVNLNY